MGAVSALLHVAHAADEELIEAAGGPKALTAGVAALVVDSPFSSLDALAMELADTGVSASCCGRCCRRVCCLSLCIRRALRYRLCTVPSARLGLRVPHVRQHAVSTRDLPGVFCAGWLTAV